MKHTPRRLTSSIRVALLAAAAALLALALPAASSALPNDRAYEMVSPPEKNGQGVGAGLFMGSYRAAGDGHAIGYTAMGGWGDSPAYGAAGFYQGTRGEEGWSNTSLLLPIFTPSELFSTGPKGVSRDFTKEVVDTNLDQDTGEETPDDSSWTYLVDTATKERELLTGPSLSGRRYFTAAGDFKGSDDFSVVAFSASVDLTPEVEGLSGYFAYRYTDGELKVISEDSDGVLGNGRIHSTGRPVSADGSVVFYSFGTSGVAPLYRRDFSTGDDPAAVLVNASENTGESIPEGPASFVSASRDGSIAFFTSTQKLVDADTDAASDLYRWDGSKAAGDRLTLISADGESDDGETGAVSTPGAGSLVSPDGSRIYFVHDSQLVDGEPTDPGKKLYAWDADDGLRFIERDNTLGARGNEPVMSVNGEYLGLLTTADLTGDNDTGLGQAYLYDYAADSITCASCAPGPDANTAAAQWRMSINTTAFTESDIPVRNVSNNGDVFFETTEGLLPNDTNNKFDVYAWKDGTLDMLSTGRSSDNSLFADADASGENAFFYTREQLSGWDTDNQLDLYDARVNGGLPEPPTAPAPCTGDDCQGDPAGEPGFEDPGTSTYEGEGNQPPKANNRCRKAERKSNRLERRAKQLRRKAHRAHTKKQTRRLNKRAKRVSKKARKASRRATRCNRRAQS